MEAYDLGHLARPRRLARAETEPVKRCRACCRHKPIAAFAIHPLALDGHRHDCKSCVGKGKKPADFNRASARRTRYARRRRKADPSVQARNRIAVADWTRRHPEALLARNLLKRAVKRGEVKKASRCAAKGCSKHNVEGHHPDYRKPLEVLWTCRRHHRRLHAGEALPLKASVDPRLARIPRSAAA